MTGGGLTGGLPSARRSEARPPFPRPGTDRAPTDARYHGSFQVSRIALKDVRGYAEGEDG